MVQLVHWIIPRKKDKYWQESMYFSNGKSVLLIYTLLCCRSQAWECHICGKINTKLSTNSATPLTQEESTLLQNISFKVSTNILVIYLNVIIKKIYFNSVSVINIVACIYFVQAEEDAAKIKVKEEPNVEEIENAPADECEFQAVRQRISNTNTDIEETNNIDEDPLLRASVESTNR